MTDGLTPPPADDDLAQVVRELSARVSWLEIEGARLRESIAAEIRTRRVVVVDDGGDRIVLAAHDRFGHVTVLGRTTADDSTCVELFANDPANGEGVEVGVALIERGDAVATLHVFEGSPPRLWIADEPDDPLIR